MKTSQRTRILVEGERELLFQFAKQIELQYDMQIERQPMKSLAMTKARDLVSRQPFYLGEALLTECIVSIENCYGFGAVMGEDLDKAYALAVVDAAFRARLPETLVWIALLMEEEKKIERRHQEELAASLRTKVDFATKEEETNDKR